jgi:transposase-like protein
MPESLSAPQAHVVAALAQGRTVTAAAQAAGINRNTIYNWLDQPEFKTAVEAAEHEYVAILTDGMRDLAAQALETLRNLLEDPKTPPAVRLKTALAILQRPHFPQRGWHLPERIEDPREQQLVDNLAEMKADYDAMRMQEAMSKHNPSVSAGAPSRNAQPKSEPPPSASSSGEPQNVSSAAD